MVQHHSTRRPHSPDTVLLVLIITTSPVVVQGTLSTQLVVFEAFACMRKEQLVSIFMTNCFQASEDVPPR